MKARCLRGLRVLSACALLSTLAAPGGRAQSDGKTKRQRLAGAAVRSDEWIIHRKENKEEFIGDVSYRHNGDLFTADWAEYDRALEVFRTKGRTYAKRMLENGEQLEIWADLGEHRLAERQGSAKADAGKDVRLLWASPSSGTIHGLSLQGAWDEAQQWIQLDGNVRLNASSGAAASSGVFELEAATARHELLTGRGSAKAESGKDMRLLWTSASSGSVHALAQEGSWDQQKQTMNLEGQVRIRASSGPVAETGYFTVEADTAYYEMETAKGTATARGAEPVHMRRHQADGSVLIGDARTTFWDGRGRSMSLREDVYMKTSSETARALSADYLEAEGALLLEGGPPVLLFKADTFEGALQADRIRLESETGRMRAEGQAHGWIHFQDKNGTQSRGNL